jgi:hypothetical protein
VIKNKAQNDNRVENNSYPNDFSGNNPKHSMVKLIIRQPIYLLPLSSFISYLHSPRMIFFYPYISPGLLPGFFLPERCLYCLRELNSRDSCGILHRIYGFISRNIPPQQVNFSG